MTPSAMDVRAPAWRPDGEALASVADTHERDEHTYGRSDRMIRYPESYPGGWTPWRTLYRYWAAMQWWNRWLKNVPVS